MKSVQNLIQNIDERIALAAQKSGRLAQDISIVAVSKKQTLAHIESCLKVANFPKALGENYLHELEQKVQGLSSSLKTRVEWHFLGALQSRKIPDVKKCATVVHSVCRAKEIEILADVQGGPCPKFFLQVNLSQNQNKGGARSRDELLRLIEVAEQFSVLDQCAGLMAFPDPLSQIGESEVRREFSQVSALRDVLLAGRGLSMGTSEDFEIAIEEGATLLRLGTVLFGERPAKN